MQNQEDKPKMETTQSVAQADMRDLIEFIARGLVDTPDSVEVAEFGDSEASIIKLKVSKDDLGKVIGKKGRTAKAMRTLLSAAASKVKKRSTLEIIE